MADARIIITAETQQAQVAIANLNRSLGNIEGTAAQAKKGLDGLASTAKLMAGAFVALSAGIGIREIVGITARFTDLNSRLINATGSAAAASQAFEAISASARGTYSDLETTAQVFLQNAMALNELGYTTNEQIKLSTALNNAMAVSGARGEQAASALDAFAKAIAGGKMQGEDLNRILDNAPELIKALADGLGVTTEQFRKMVREGKITSDVMIPAVLSQMDLLQKKADDMPATLSDGFVLMSNALFEFVGKADAALGISTSLAEVLKFLANNIHLVIGGVVGLGVGVLALTLKMMGLATATALATGGLSIIAAGAAGVAMAALAEKMGVFAFMAKESVDPLKAAAQAQEDAAAAANRKVMAAQKELLLHQDILKPLFSKLQMEKESIGLNELELATKRNLAEATKLLADKGQTLSQQSRERVINDTQSIVLSKQKEAIDRVIRDLDTERLELVTQDKNQREIILAIRKQELDFGRALTQEEQTRLSVSLQQTQALREQVGIKNAIADATRKQTQLEKINRALQLQSTLDPISALQKQFQRDQAALEAAFKNKLLTEQQYNDQRLVLEEQFAFAKLNLQNQELLNHDRINKLKLQMDLDRINQILMAEQAGSAAVLSTQDQAILQRQGAEARQAEIVGKRIEFEKKSELEKTTFALDNMQTVFAALGAQNRKAFEASKALAIASALVNTYQAATKALATYPFPFGLIAAAGAVAAGMAQVSAIRSQQYSGRQLGGPVMGNKSYIVGENGPEMFTPTTNGSITRNNEISGQGSTNINFTIVANDSQGFDDLLSARQGMIKQMIADAMIERGQRSMI